MTMGLPASCKDLILLMISFLQFEFLLFSFNYFQNKCHPVKKPILPDLQRTNSKQQQQQIITLINKQHHINLRMNESII